MRRRDTGSWVADEDNLKQNTPVEKYTQKQLHETQDMKYHDRLEKQYKLATLESLSKLVLTDDQIVTYHSRGIYKKIASVYYSEKLKNYYYIHPETIQLQPESLIEEAYICHTCLPILLDTQNNPSRLPEFCVANGFDYGDFRRLPPHVVSSL